MMIYVTGDCHGDFQKFSTKRFPEQKELTKEDYVIICGDFGGVWNYEEESNSEKYWLDWLNDKPFTTLFIDGNHENFDRLYSYPESDWNGGKVHKIRSFVFHLMRGEIFTINEKRIYAFGGAASHDIKDGILDMSEEDKIYLYRKTGRYFRIRNFSWWDRELPTENEMQNGLRNLEKVNYNVDYVISHCAPTSIQLLIDSCYKSDVLTNYHQKVQNELKFKKWFFGHYHMDKAVNAEFICVYNEIIPLIW
ncbi:MAG: metallophosphoesterase [Clostridiales bacterium]|nr:metallophosphoesterase [Clostridiales bacterium]